VRKVCPVEQVEGLDLIIGRTILEASVTSEGLHMSLDDGNVLVIIGTFYAGITVSGERSLQ